jgi:hypothetical protein
MALTKESGTRASYMQPTLGCIWLDFVWLAIGHVGDRGLGFWFTDCSCMQGRLAVSAATILEAQQLRRLSVSMRSAYGRQARKRVNCMSCDMCVGCCRSLHHTRADNRAGGNPSLNFTSSECPSCRQSRPRHRIRFRVRIASISCFT